MVSKDEIQTALKAVASASAGQDAASSEEITCETSENKTLTLSMAEVRKVVKAEWGCGDKWQDCTPQVSQYLMVCQPLKCTNENLGGDPAPRSTKTLKVTYLPPVKRTVECDSGTMVAYSAHKFHEMRAAHGIEKDAFFASMTDEELKGGGVEASGKSGEIFWFTTDGSYVLKTAPENELFNLLSMLSDYTAYLKDNNDSLLCRYFAAFHFTSKTGAEVRFIVMNNVFQGSKTHVMYDLKGTTEDRWVDEEKGGCLKDNNFAPITMYVSSEGVAGKIREVIRTDTEFLEKHRIMDYSLMLAIQYLDKDSEERYHKSTSSLMGGLLGTATRGVLDKATHEKCIFYIGMVDMLVTYSLKKQMAHFMKANTIGHFDKIDTEPPDVYADRFRKYFTRKILDQKEDIEITQVSSDLFESPMPALGRSGGTAAFFKATLTADPPPSKNYWIAKDLSRAMDELGFYELAKKHEDSADFALLKWMTEYKGVCTVPCQVKAEGDPEDVQVLLIRNGRDGYKTCRMLDIKIGYATAVAGWQGKSALAAWQQGFVDSNTNSVMEGFRLEGFDNPPPVLQSFQSINSDNKKLKRMGLQSMTAFDFLKIFLDVHDVRQSEFAKKCKDPEVSEYTPFSGDGALTEVELQELLLLNIIEELAGFVAACRSCPCPQQWIGSSVMLAFDSDARPNREEALGASGPKRGLARVHVFDWGRSELNTPEHHSTLSETEKAERKKYWGLYCGGVAKLLFDCCALYVGRYWHEISGLVFTVWDKDRFKDDDFIGKCVMDLDAKQEVVKELTNWGGDPIKAGMVMKSASKMVVSMSPFDLPESSRLRAGTSARVHRCDNLPNMDALVLDHTDAFVEVTGLPKHVLEVSKKVQQAMRDIAHSTSLCMDSESPVFEEEFKFGVLREESKADVLKALGIALGLDGSMEEEDLLLTFVSHKTNLEKDTKEAASKFAERCFPDLDVVPSPSQA